MKNKDDPEKASTAMLNWFQILMLIGQPLWDAKQQKWRIFSGYQSVLGNGKNIFFEVTFTDTLNWEDFTKKELYINVPVKNKDNKSKEEKDSKSKK